MNKPKLPKLPKLETATKAALISAVAVVIAAVITVVFGPRIVISLTGGDVTAQAAATHTSTSALAALPTATDTPLPTATPTIAPNSNELTPAHVDYPISATLDSISPNSEGNLVWTFTLQNGGAEPLTNVALQVNNIVDENGNTYSVQGFDSFSLSAGKSTQTAFIMQGTPPSGSMCTLNLQIGATYQGSSSEDYYTDSYSQQAFQC